MQDTEINDVTAYLLVGLVLAVAPILQEIITVVLTAVVVRYAHAWGIL